MNGLKSATENISLLQLWCENEEKLNTVKNSVKYYNNDKIISNSHTEHFQLLLVLNEFKGLEYLTITMLTRSLTYKKQKCLQSMLILPLQIFLMCSVCVYMYKYTHTTRSVWKFLILVTQLATYNQDRTQNIKLHSPLSWSAISNSTLTVHC